MKLLYTYTKFKQQYTHNHSEDTLANSPICSVNTNWKAAFQENNATQQAELAHSTANTKTSLQRGDSAREAACALIQTAIYG